MVQFCILIHRKRHVRAVRDTDDAVSQADGADGDCQHRRSNLMLRSLLHADEPDVIFRVSDKHPDRVGRGGAYGRSDDMDDLLDDHLSDHEADACDGGGHYRTGRMERRDDAVSHYVRKRTEHTAVGADDVPDAVRHEL